MAKILIFLQLFACFAVVASSHYRKLEASDENIEKALKLTNDLANLVHQRFEFDNKERFQFFIESSNMPNYGWDILKYKIAKKMLEENSQFLMIFGGSSVTAGHDNYFNQSWPIVFERRILPIFKLLGIELLVRNIAQGANNCRPADLCYEAMGGEHADWIGWEQSFNCGRDRGIFELMARVAYWAGGVAYYSASGAFLPSGCPPSADPLFWTAEEWTPEKGGVTARYDLSPEVVQAYRKLQNDWFDDGNSVSRFTSVYGPLYKGVGPHGFSVWGHSSSLCNNGTGCNAIDVKGECQDKGGPHWMVQETSFYAYEQGKQGKDWHPSAGMHLMRGEILAYNMAHIVADAIYTVLADRKSGRSKQNLTESYQAQIDALRIPIPERALYLSTEEGSQKPLCFTNYEPHYNVKQLLSGIVVGNHTGWRLIYKQERTPDERRYGYLDRRPFYEAKGAGLELYVQLLNVRSGSVRVCGYSQKESLKHALFFLDPDTTLVDPLNHPPSEAQVEHHRHHHVALSDKYDHHGIETNAYELDIPYKPSIHRYKLEHRKYMGDECTQLFDIPAGMADLHAAVRSKNIQEVKNLIANGADLNYVDMHKRAAVHLAAWTGNFEMLQVLIRAKAKLDLKAMDNFSILHFAAQSNSPSASDCIKLIVKKCKPLLHQRVTKGNKTALHLAAAKGLESNIRTLIELGADCDAKTSSGQSMLDLVKADALKAISQIVNEAKSARASKSSKAEDADEEKDDEKGEEEQEELTGKKRLHSEVEVSAAEVESEK